MAFKGVIAKGSLVGVDLTLGRARGTALVSVSFADNGGGTGVDSSTVAPSGIGHAQVQTNPGPDGILKVLVDMSDDSDTGTLTVHENGDVRDQSAITGDTVWSYALT